jgi:hypothetical protein
MKKNKNAQQVVEFALVIPVLIIIFLFIVEIGFTLNAKLILSEAVKLSIAKTGQMVGESEADIKTAIENSIKAYVAEQNLPNSNLITVEITDSAPDNTTLIKVNYTYKPIFSLFDVFGNNIIPSEFNFTSYQIINSSLLKNNDYTMAYDTATLHGFSKDSSVLKTQTIDAVDFRYQIAFLVGFNTASGGTDYNYARLFSWWGEDLLPQQLYLNIQSGNLEVKTPYYNAGSRFDTKIPYNWVLSALGYTHAIYARVDSNSALSNVKLNLASSLVSYNLSIPLFGQSSCASCGSGSPDVFEGDMLDSSIDNINKRGINLYLDGSSSPFGSFDSIDSISNNAKLQTLHQYTFGNSSYLIKLFVPSSTKPTDNSNGYNYSFNLTNGRYTAAGADDTEIVNCYIDNDGDSIPNAWDGDPLYADIDADGTLDGRQTTLGTEIYDPTIPDEVDTSTGTVVISSSGAYTVATPYTITGVLNDSKKNDSTLTSYTPQRLTFNYIRSSSGSYDAIYYKKSGTIYTRKTTNLTSLAAKSRFINGTVSGTTINLSTSKEISELLNNAFDPINKVVK